MDWSLQCSGITYLLFPSTPSPPTPSPPPKNKQTNKQTSKQKTSTKTHKMFRLYRCFRQHFSTLSPRSSFCKFPITDYTYSSTLQLLEWTFTKGKIDFSHCNLRKLQYNIKLLSKKIIQCIAIECIELKSLYL